MSKILDAMEDVLASVRCEHDLELLGPDVKDPGRWDRKRCRKCGTVFYQRKRWRLEIVR